MEFINNGMTAFLELLFNLSSSVGLPYYGVAIILFTIIIKVLLYPLTWKQMSSMRKMTEVQPKISEIQQKYKGNQQKINEKVMDLYQKENINPYAGCLPIIVQLPVLWVFYRTLMNFPYGQDESAYFFGFNLTESYGFALSYHLVLPILAGLSTYAMTKISMTMSKATMPVANNSKGKNKNESLPNPAERTQKIMLTFMPFFLAYIVATLPSGLGIYIITMNIVSALQSIYINKKLQKEDEIKAQRKAEKEARILAEKQEAEREEREAKEAKDRMKKDLKKKTQKGAQNT